MNWRTKNLILIFRFLDSFLNVHNLYIKTDSFPIKIADFHWDSYKCQNYRKFLINSDQNQPANSVNSLIHFWKRIQPEIFGEIPAQGLKFFALYQKYSSLGIAIAKLGTAVKPSCFTHSELKLNNILANLGWEDVMKIYCE